MFTNENFNYNYKENKIIQVIHSSKDIIYKDRAAFYDIDTDGGQSGSPVFA